MTSFLLMMWGGAANAGQIRATDFFDIEYAKKLWLETKSGNELEKVYATDCPNGGGQIGDVYDAWEVDYRRDPRQALKDLEGHSDAEGIKRCFDLVLTNQVWSDMYRSWRGSLSVYGGDGWNDCRNAFVLQNFNIFTGKCDDMPDWRHPKNVKIDEAAMAKGNASPWSRKKKKP